MDKVPGEWVEKVELKDEIFQIADDLLTGYRGNRDWWDRYRVINRLLEIKRAYRFLNLLGRSL